MHQAPDSAEHGSDDAAASAEEAGAAEDDGGDANSAKIATLGPPSFLV